MKELKGVGMIGKEQEDTLQLLKKQLANIEAQLKFQNSDILTSYYLERKQTLERCIAWLE